MSTDSISSLINHSTYTGAASKKDNAQMSMEDFFSLLVAQLKNQDMNNPMDDSQFITQMAQFSMVQAMADMSEISSANYSMSLIGKEATIANIRTDGSLETIVGIIEGVNMYNGSAQVVVRGMPYDLSSVMIVSDATPQQNELIANVNLIGRKVTISTLDEEGKAVRVSGIVEGVTQNTTGAIEVLVDGKKHLLSGITEVIDPNAETPEEESGDQG